MRDRSEEGWKAFIRRVFFSGMREESFVRCVFLTLQWQLGVCVAWLIEIGDG